MHGRNLLIRAAVLGDADALLGMMVDFNAIEGIAFDPARTRPALARLLGEPALGRVLLAAQGARTVGYAVLTWGFDLEFDGRDAFLTEIYLLPEARGRGLGGELLAEVEVAARTAGARAVHLMVRPENTAGVALYRRAGYESPGRLLLSKRLAGQDR
ncbi:MAG TPA: GNAT family N-acetyltransferase [Polyangiaceae bacterium]|jgi:ribosomal protein S18 acetylase RimI-like enzyme